MSRSIRTAVFLLAAILIASGAVAAPRTAPKEREAGIIALISRFLGSFIPAIEKARGSMDPDGQPASSPTTEDDGDARAGMDPDGHA